MSTGEFPQVVRRAKCARILQFAKSVTDSSGRVAVETANATSWRLGLRLRLYLLHGASSTDFGEKANSSKLELYARYYF